MSYTTYATIVYLTGTTYAQADIEAMITKADAVIDGWLAELGTTGTAGNAKLDEACADITMAKILFRMSFDNSKPNSLTIGEFNASDNTDRKIEALMAEARTAVDGYVASQLSSTIHDEFDTSAVRADSKMGQMNLSQRPVYEYHEDADDDDATDPGDYT